MPTETDLTLPGGRTLHVYSHGPGDPVLTVVWQHGSPNLGAPPEPLFAASDRLGIRWLSYDRPGYGTSAHVPGRDVASAAADVAAIADAFGVPRFAVFGSSGGGPHALACAALLPDRVTGVVSQSGLAPYDAAGLDWSAGMRPTGMAELRAAADGPDALAAVLADAEFDPESFTEADHDALRTDWHWLWNIAGAALQGGNEGLIADDVANTHPWGFVPDQVVAPALFLHGDEDRMVPVTHGRWLAQHCPHAELRVSPGDGHVSVLRRGGEALEWLVAR